MRGSIFKDDELEFWKKYFNELEDFRKRFPINTVKEYEMNFILHTIKSYKPSPNGNGMKWSRQEKEKFSKLSYKEQRKMIVIKSELKSTLLPYVNVDYEPYKYNDRISDMAKKTYGKAKSLLEANKKLDFNNINPKIQQEIFHNLRVAYKEQYLKAGVELAELLFKHSRLSDDESVESEIFECANIVHALLDKKIPEISYMYYQLYKWGSDDDRIFFENITHQTLKLSREQARECYDYALKSVLWEAIDEEASRDDIGPKIFAAELYLAAAIKYQSPLAFSLAAHNYAPNDIFPYSYNYSIIMKQACLRCNIALGGGGAWKLIDCYRQGFDFKSPLKAARLETYAKKSPKQKGLINGLDPYFDEKFPPELLIDLSAAADNDIYGGSKRHWGIEYLSFDKGLIKDPREKGSTLESIKKYYLMVWKIIVENYNSFEFKSNTLDLRIMIICKMYSKLQYGLPSARPYIFPKEVLDLEIDFSKGLEEDYKMHGVK